MLENSRQNLPTDAIQRRRIRVYIVVRILTVLAVWFATAMKLAVGRCSGARSPGGGSHA